MPIKLLVADDHTLVRQGIVKLLSTDKDIEVVGESSDGFDVVAKCQELQPDAILMDMYMPSMDGVAATRLIAQKHPNVQVIVLTASTDDDDVLQAVQAGARGYILKNSSVANLFAQIKEVLNGGVAFSAEMTSKLVAGLSREPAVSMSSTPRPTSALTPREEEVLDLVSQGKTNKEIANALFVSENTVRAHIRSLMQKLEMDNRTQLAVYGLREGFGLHNTDDVDKTVAPTAAAPTFGRPVFAGLTR